MLPCLISDCSIFQIRYRKGIEMLKIFKSYASKTSLLDDFMYYENRQKIMQEEKAKLLMNNYDNPFLVPVLDPPRKLVVDLPCKEEDRVSKKDLNSSDKNDAAPPPGETIGLDGNESNLSPTDRNIPVLSNGEASLETALKIGSLTITTKQSVPEALDEVPTSGSASNSASSDVVTVGSLPVKVNRFAESSGFLVGTIPLDPKAFE